LEDIILINITGKDKPGLTASLTGILGKYQVNILDIGQAVIHDYLSLGILIKIPAEHRSSSVLKDLLYAGHEKGINVSFSPVQSDNYEEWAAGQGKPQRIITMLGRNLTAEQVSRVADIIAENGLNIEIINRLSRRVSMLNPNAHPMACIQLTVSGNLSNPKTFRGQLLSLSADSKIDISFHLDDIYQRNRRVVVFDMDSTLIQVEVIDELAKIAGVEEEVRAITNSAMNGEIDFEQSLRQRISLLEGLDENALKGLLPDLPLSQGAERVTTTLKKLGYKVGIISGGFSYFSDYLKNRLNLHYTFANEIEIKNGRLTGKITGRIIDGQMKARLLKEIALKENIMLDQTIAVGDGANDLPMLSIAGMGVAFHAKKIVKDNTRKSISTVGLDGLLYLMGISEREINGATTPVSQKG